MKTTLRVALDTSDEESGRLQSLQKAFAEVCNALAPLVRDNHCWNRVTLHHLAYKSLRQRFPALGSQMVCNAIYSVSRTARIVFQHPESPFNHARLAGKPLPLLRFADTSPVYFDRHTLSLKDGALSMYTLDGRMRFRVAVRPADELRFHQQKLREIVLSRRPDGVFELALLFSAAEGDEADARSRDSLPREAGIPQYVMVEAAA